MSIQKVAGPGRPKGRRYSNAQTSQRYRVRLKERGITELRGLRPSKSELEVFEQLVAALGYGTRNEMIICELLKLGRAHGIVPVRKSV